MDQDTLKLVLIVTVLVVPIFIGMLAYFCCKRKYKKKTDTKICLLCICIPFLPILWLYHWLRRHRLNCYRCFTRLCDVRRPGARNSPPKVIEENRASEEGFSWYLHSYLACCIQWGCCALNMTKDMTVLEAIHRYVEGPRSEWEDLLKSIETNKYLSFLIEYLNRREPKFYFRILPSGSIRERFGYPLPSTSVLASDYDLMLVPDGVFVYDQFTEREGRFPALFTAVDDPNQNPERPKGFLWLKLENSIEVWKKLCYERITNEGVVYYLSQLAVLDVIIDQIGHDTFLKQFNQYMHLPKELKTYELKSERTGPALNVNIIKKNIVHKIPFVKNVAQEPEQIFDADFTLALRCPKFPRDAKYFFERRTNTKTSSTIHWPTKEIVERIEELGCHVVPKPSKKTLSSFQKEQMLNSYLGTSAVLEWRYSFSQAEMLLADDIPEKARTSYLALKAVIKTHINRTFDDTGYAHKIPSYALKTILFFEVEKLEESYWTSKEEVEEEFFWVLFESLRQKVTTKKCPHYWIETLNLFADMKDEDFAFMIAKLDEIEAQPVKYIASEWLEWNRYMQKGCCASCVHPGDNKRHVYGQDFEPIPCCCGCPIVINQKVKTGSEEPEEKQRLNIKYDEVAIQVY